MDEGRTIKTENVYEEEQSLREEDMSKFIQLVKNRPELYDSSLKEHNNLELVRSLWQDISREFNVPVSACKVKWHCLRTSYNRYLRDLNKLSTNSKVKKKKWHLADKMSFLQSYICPHKKPSVSLIPPEFVSVGESFKDSFVTDSGDDSQTVEESLTNYSVPRKRKSTAEVVVAYLKHMDEKNTIDDDPIMCFFKGLLPDINRLSGRRKRNFRGDVLKTLNFYLDQQEDETSRSSSSFNSEYHVE